MRAGTWPKPRKSEREARLGVCVSVCVSALLAQLYLTLCDPMDYSWPGSSVHGIFQARTLDWVAIPFSRLSSQSRDWIQVAFIAGRFLTVWVTREAPMFRNTAILFNRSIGYILGVVRDKPGEITQDGSVGTWGWSSRQRAATEDFKNVYFIWLHLILVFCKEIQPVHPEGDQSWVFIGRTDTEAETPVL